MQKYTLEEIKEFKTVATEILEAEKLFRGEGICQEMYCEMKINRGSIPSFDPQTLYHKECTRLSYRIMYHLLTSGEYVDGLGRNGEFTDNRRNFLTLISVMPAKDILSIVNHSIKQEF